MTPSRHIGAVSSAAGWLRLFVFLVLVAAQFGARLEELSASACEMEDVGDTETGETEEDFDDDGENDAAAALYSKHAWVDVAYTHGTPQSREADGPDEPPPELADRPPNA